MHINQKQDNPAEIPPPKTHAHVVARWMIRPFVNTPLTPNHVTTLRLLSGVATALLFATGDYPWVVAGGLVFVFSMLCDRADGELARLTGQSSSWGHWYDLVCDMLVNMLVFIGIGYGLTTHAVLGEWALLMGIIAGGSIGAIFIIVFSFHTSGTHPGVVFHYPDGFDLDDTLFIIPVLAWFNQLLPLLIAAVIGAPAFLLFSLWQARRV